MSLLANLFNCAHSGASCLGHGPLICHTSSISATSGPRFGFVLSNHSYTWKPKARWTGSRLNKRKWATTRRNNRRRWRRWRRRRQWTEEAKCSNVENDSDDEDSETVSDRVFLSSDNQKCHVTKAAELSANWGISSLLSAQLCIMLHGLFLNCKFTLQKPPDFVPYPVGFPLLGIVLSSFIKIIEDHDNSSWEVREIIEVHDRIKIDAAWTHMSFVTNRSRVCEQMNIASYTFA